MRNYMINFPNMSHMFKEESYTMKSRLLLILLFLLISALFSPVFAQDQKGSRPGSTRHEATATEPVYPAMPKPGEKVAIGGGRYMVYGFVEEPKMGTSIMKVRIFTSDGKKDTSLKVVADSGMPSMRGAHETGERTFQTSKKGDYLLPIDIVMPGGWEVRLTVLKEGKVIFRGRYDFDV